jgi:predicted transcriptional regulator
MPMARLSAQAHSRLQQIAGRSGQSQQEVLEDAIALYDRKQFFEDANRAYAALRDDKQASEALEAERRVFDEASEDGFSDPSIN